MKGKDRVGALSQGSPNEGELAGKEVVEPKRPCKINTRDIVVINARSKTHVVAQKISQVVSPR